MSRKTTIIAEIGENHFGNIDLAKGLLVTAAENGADIVKFQSYRSADTAPDDPEREWFTAVELSDEDHFELKHLADEKGVRFISSPFTVERARFLLERLELTEIKVASGKMRNRKLLDYLNSRADLIKTVYISTGTATIDEIRPSVKRLGDIEKVVIFHCVSSYPCADVDANLRCITTLQKEFPDHRIGYSDHTQGNLACMMAVALGAAVIEKHFTFNQLMPGTDHLCAITPQELADLVGDIARIELMRGSGEKTPTEQEKKILPLLKDRFND
ncbi:MAG: N-acetylneuraminate synthase family protein [Phycisphaerae bacterium]|nr:N-acetylneuraminate synthase family protein [Phycisphaerae bacterium]